MKFYRIEKKKRKLEEKGFDFMISKKSKKNDLIGRISYKPFYDVGINIRENPYLRVGVGSEEDTYIKEIDGVPTEVSANNKIILMFCNEQREHTYKMFFQEKSNMGYIYRTNALLFVLRELYGIHKFDDLVTDPTKITHVKFELDSKKKFNYDNFLCAVLNPLYKLK